MILGIHLMRKQIRLRADFYDKDSTTPSDYTL
jgi:hypothetical protein